ncbi:proline-rich protein PRCC isoform X2 [Podarcis raffonei]|uniref:proline-rich protein PRCC isoform X2 n=1 Tax=Podarcis raffonei TaxID=65483 RepID=UPI002329495B|nr:proline-rich protein PRCC isoform X2 [Podarcis raffonei]
MSLVAYASSEEEEQEESDAAEEEGGGTDGDDDDDEEATEEQERGRELGRRGGGGRGLFSALPPPKAGAGIASQQQPHRPLAAGLPLPLAPRPIPASSTPPLLAPAAAASERAPGKKRTQPVRIAAPHLGDSDSEEDEPAKKHPSFQAQSEGSGLSALLPQPKNLTVKETNRLLLPYAFSRKAAAAAESSPDAKSAKGLLSSKPKPPLKAPSAVTATTTPSPSAIKAAAKSAALQVTKQITQEENDSDEEVAPENYFSLSDRSDAPALSPEAYAYPGPVVPDDLPPGTEPDPEPESQDAAANAPLEFKTGPGASSASHGWAPKPGEDYGGQHYALYPGCSDAGGPSPYYQFKRLQGKRNRGREEINFVEIKGDDQLSGAQQWLTKSLTEEQNMKSFSKKKGEQPTGQQRRKHQITYLIHQAKERELELKNTWAENKLSRRQTQAKYGF